MSIFYRCNKKGHEWKRYKDVCSRGGCNALSKDPLIPGLLTTPAVRMRMEQIMQEAVRDIKGKFE